jgi:predicted nicotinamide N-methyase
VDPSQCSNHGWYGGDEDARGSDGEPCARRHAGLDDKQKFDVIIGADICYEPDHPALLQGVLQRRLAPGGRVFFLYAVRFPALHAEMLERLQEVCSDVCSQSVDSTKGALAVDIIEEGCTQHSHSYPGGMQLVSGIKH